MDNSPKFNPLEVDDEVWIAVKNNYPQKKSCWLCKLAPLVFFFAINLIGYHNHWYYYSWFPFLEVGLIAYLCNAYVFNNR
jgi:hypothetical protein